MVVCEGGSSPEGTPPKGSDADDVARAADVAAAAAPRRRVVDGLRPRRPTLRADALGPLAAPASPFPGPSPVTVGASLKKEPGLRSPGAAHDDRQVADACSCCAAFTGWGDGRSRSRSALTRSRPTERMGVEEE
jgi:hypothetical protein